MTDPLQRAHAAPKFAAPDPIALAAWYRDALGFPRIDTWPEARYAIVGRGALTLHLWCCAERHIAENTACYVEMSDVSALDALHAEWSAAAKRPGFAPGRVEETPRDQHGHGMREFHVWDPAGNLIGLGAALSDD